MDKIRFGGMASGLDTESIVNQLMQVEKMKVKRYTDKKTYAEWKQEEYNSVNKMMANYILDSRKEMGFNNISSVDGSIKPGSVEKLDWLKKATSSNEEAFSVKANSKSFDGSFEMRVFDLAKSAKRVSKEATNFNSSTKLSEVLGPNDNKPYKITINGKQTTLEGSLTVEQAMKKLSDDSKKDKGQQLNINFDNTTSRVFMSTKKTGKSAKINFKTLNGNDPEDDTLKFLEKFKLGETKETKGKDAIIEFEGAELSSESNEISINGMDITLKGVTDLVPHDENGDIIKEKGKIPTSKAAETITVTTNIDGAVDKIKNFVEKYNKLIDDLDSKIKEKKPKNFILPSEEEKKAMNKDDIELIEKKAKEGLLYNDKIIRNLLDKMRSDMYKKVKHSDGSEKAMYEFGITTGRYQDGGKLVIDETKLRKALSEDADGVMNTLFKSSDKSYKKIYPSDSEGVRKEKIKNNNDLSDESGVFVRMYNTMMDGMEDIIKESGPGKDTVLLRNVRGNILIDYATKYSNQSKIGKSLNQINKTIDSQNERLYRLEESYWKKFAALEKAIQQMQSQGSWLAQQFGGGAQ